MTLIKNAAIKYLNLYLSYDGNKGNFHWKIKKVYPRFYNAISSNYGCGFNQKIYNLINNILTAPLCKICNASPVSFKNIEAGYKTYCSDICSYKDPELIQHRKNTMIKKYGVEYALQNKALATIVSKKNKSKFTPDGDGRLAYVNTMITRYGVLNPMEIAEFRKKISITHAKRTDIQIKHTVLKRKHTNLEKYGDEHYCNIEKIKTTLKTKYGVEYPNQTKCSQSWLQIDDKKTFLESILPHHHPLKIAKDYNLGFSTVYKLINSYGLKDLIRKTFNGEHEIDQYIQSLGFKTHTNNRHLLGGKELDIVVDDMNIAIEHNGVYWHSESHGKDKNYHLTKTELCSKQGIQLLHIFDTEWLEKRNIVESIISAKLGKFKHRIYARQCVIKEIDTQLKDSFLDINHLQGKDKSKIKLGLFHDEDLVAIMTFGVSRFNKHYEWEMHRYCNKIGYQIVGGAGKLWHYFKINFQPNSVITYADRRYSNGRFYKKIGFECVGVSSPNFFVLNNGKLESRIKWQKHKLHETLDIYNHSLTAWENMLINGYDRVWDCGNFVFSWRQTLGVP